MKKRLEAKTSVGSLICIGFFFIFPFSPAAQEHQDYSAYFTMDFQNLLGVNISTAGKMPERVGDIPASVVIITREEIELSGFSSLREILNSISGYYAMSNLGVDIYGVRGIAKGKGTKGNNFVVLINNMKITDNKILTFYQIPVEAIDRIEVVRGPLSVIYGDNAFFGAINIITNETLNKKSSYRCSFSYGSMNTRELFGRIAGDQGDLKFALNFSVFGTDGMDAPLEKMISRPERMDEPLFGGTEGKGLGLPGYAQHTKGFLERNQKFVNFSAELKNFYFTSNYIESLNGWVYYYPSLDEGTYVQNRSTTLALGYKNEITKSLSIDTKIRYSRLFAYYTYNHLFEGFYGTDMINFNELNGEFNCFWNPVTQMNISFGLEYDNMLNYVNDTNVPIASLVNFTYNYIDPDDNGETWASYIQADYSFFNRLKLIAGLRVGQLLPYNLQILRYQGVTPPTPETETEISDQKEKGDVDIMPRFAVIFNIDRNNIIKLLYGKAVKRPSYHVFGEDMLDIYIGAKESYSMSEYIHTLEFNYLSSISKKLGLNMSVFWNRLEHMILEKSAIVDQVLRAWYENGGKIETKGVEATLQYKPAKEFHFELSGVFQETRDVTLDIDASYSPHFLGYLKWIFNSPKGFSMSLTGNYVGKMKPFFNSTPIFDNQGDPTGEYAGRSSQDVDSYFLLNANFRIDPFLYYGFYLNIHLSNILNAEYYYPTFSINNAWADRGTLGEGRSVLLTIGLKFE